MAGQYFEMNMPTKLYCGEGALKKLPDICRGFGFGRNILLVTSKELAAAEKAVLANFDPSGFSIEVFYLESPEPTCNFIDSSNERLKARRPDCIIGLGGGSAIDMAKALSIALTQSEPVWMYANLSNRPPLPLKAPVLPVVAIPTTAGTGSEVTPYAVLSNSETRQKGTVQEPQLFPKAAFFEPALTASMPPELTAATGIDALAHALESYINVSKFSPVSEWAGKEAIRIVMQTLTEVYKNPDDLGLRAKMSWASTLAGIAIAHRGTTTTHAIAEPLGALTHIPHAGAIAVCTLPVMRRTWRHIPDKLSGLHDAVTPRNDIDAESKAGAFVKGMEELFAAVGMDRKVRDYIDMQKHKGLALNLLDNVLQYKLRPLKQHPVEFDKDALFEIIEEII